ncbi:MAG: hypothetical protein Q7R81_03075 [Candidatus Peregrinibacteria bacterium]|nr:hypothetical protein [Candidatus Peregrinibacteria bacterium]
MWFLFAFTYALLLSIVIVFDRFTIVGVFTRPLQGMFMTVPASIALLIAVSPIVTWPSPRIFLLSLLSGIFLQAAQACYFVSMGYAEEAGDLSAIESTYPVLVAIISIYLGHFLKLSEIVGILIVVSAILGLTINRKICWDAKFFIFIAADIIFLSAHGILVNYTLKGIPFLSFYAPYSIGIVLFGLSPFILSKKERISFLLNWHKIKNILPHLSLIEIGNVLALIAGTYALSIGHPALVTSVMSTYPAIVFIMCFSLSFSPKFSEEGFARTDNFSRKILLILVMSIGLGMLAKFS